MATLFGTKYTRYQGDEYQSSRGYIRRDAWTAPAAASATAQLNASALDGATVTSFVGQPDVARNLQLVASGATTDNVTINGTDIRGAAVSETIALNGTTPVVTTRAFKTVTSIVKPTVGSTTLSVGTSVKLGLSRKVVSAGDFFHGTADGVKEGTAPTLTAHATDISKNLVSFNSAPNGSRALAVVYLTTELSDK